MLVQPCGGRWVRLGCFGLLLLHFLSFQPFQSSSTYAQSTPTAKGVWLPLVRAPFTPFNPSVNGFGFANYTRTPLGVLTSVEMRRLFGDAACGSAVASDGTCTLTPPAARWRDFANDAMNNGYCEGMNIVSSLMFNRILRPQDFGAERVQDLVLEGNTKLQRQIAYWSATQLLNRANTTKNSPNEVLVALRESISAKGNGFGTLRFAMPNGAGGHSVLPISVRDVSSTTVAITVYDSDYPRETRELVIDTAANTWFYSPDASQTADDYRGDAQTKTLGFAPIAPRLAQQACPFCAPVEAASPMKLNAIGNIVPQSNIIDTSCPYIAPGVMGAVSTACQQAIDASNRANLEQFFPGAQQGSQQASAIPSWQLPAQTYYTASPSDALTFNIVGAPQQTMSLTSSLVFISQGFTFEVGNLVNNGGQPDTFSVAPGGKQVTYTTATGEVPELFVGFETTGADYGLSLGSFEMEAGDQVVLDIDSARKLVKVRIDTASPTDDVIFSLAMERIDQTAVEIFDSPDDGLTLANGETLLIDYSEWDGNGKPLRVGYDDNNNGALDAGDEILEIQDVGDTFEEE